MKSKKFRASGKSRFFLKVILFFNIIFAVCLILSYIAVYISPDDFWIIAFFGISYPVFFLLNFIFIIFWLLFKRKYTLISVVIIVVGINNFFKIVQSSKKYDVKELKDAVKVMSFNVRNFDLYNYGKHWEYNFTRKNKIFSLLKKESPDILCFQEYVYDTTGDFQTTDTLKKFLEAKNAHIVFTSNARNFIYFGIATYTRFPIVDTGRIEFKTISGNICIYTDIKIKSDTVRIYNVHFESIRLKSEDYMFAENLAKNPNEHIGIKKNSERILGRFKRAFIIRAPQVKLVAEHIKKCPYPIIFCGDFNDTPTSYAYHTIAANLTDAFVESGNGIGQTYAGIFPSFRIDYIMHGKEFKAYNYETIEEEMSDHYPIKCFLKFKK
ncbi:MAG: endonuclease/exonuclease/phosphatase family protein [Bacteroidales bacterium]